MIVYTSSSDPPAVWRPEMQLMGDLPIGPHAVRMGGNVMCGCVRKLVLAAASRHDCHRGPFRTLAASRHTDTDADGSSVAIQSGRFYSWNVILEQQSSFDLDEQAPAPLGSDSPPSSTSPARTYTLPCVDSESEDSGRRRCNESSTGVCRARCVRMCCKVWAGEI